MRSVIIIAGGLVLLTILALAAWRIGGNAQSAATAAKVFIPIWLVAAFVNMWLGCRAPAIRGPKSFRFFW